MKKDCLFIRFLKWLLPWKGDGFGEIMRKLVFLLAAIIFLTSAGYLSNYFYQRYKSSQTATEISQMYYGNTGPDVPMPPGYQEKFRALYAINTDIKGWITIPGTTIDYPVLQSSDNNYYLRKNIYKSYDINGTPFLDYRNDISPETQSDNLVIYGHHMKFDGVFGVLIHYNDLSFYREHPIINFDSVYRDMQWAVLSAFYINTDPNDDNGYVFDYQNYIDLSDPDVFDEYIDQITKRSVISTNVDVKYGDKLLTLSTCADEFKNARFVVVARMIRPGEDANIDVSKAVYNPSPVYPEVWYTL